MAIEGCNATMCSILNTRFHKKALNVIFYLIDFVMSLRYK